MRTPRLLIRPLSEVPAQAMLQYFEENRAHFARTDPPRPEGFYTLEYREKQRQLSAQEFAADSAARFVLFKKENLDTPIGTVSLTQISRGPFQACYLGYGIHHAFEGQGYMREALEAVIRYAFDTLNLHRIMANHLVENHRSAALLKRLGFVVEGVAKNYLLIGEDAPGALSASSATQWRDHVLNSLTHPDWRPKSAKPRGSYDQWSEFYDDFKNSTIAVDDLEFPKYWAHVRGQRVLEIGCGTGRHTERLIAQQNDVSGLDVSAGMIGVARRKLKGQPVELIQADFVSYRGFPPQTFDAIVESLVIEHIGDLRLFFTRVFDLLKSGGSLFMSEIHPDRAAAGKRAHYRDPVSGHERWLESFAHTEAEIRAAAEGAGLVVDSVQPGKGGDGLARIQIWVMHRR